MKQTFDQYLDDKKAKKALQWSVDYGEEAKIESESKIECMLQLENKMIAVAAEENGGNSKNIEIYDPSAEFEKVTTVYTFHTEPITKMVEHRKMLLTASADCSIGLWDIQNNYSLVH